jgi:hypothetical protein
MASWCKTRGVNASWQDRRSGTRDAAARLLWALLLACACALSACSPYDSQLLPPPSSNGGSGGAGMDGSVGGAGGDGGSNDGGPDGCSMSGAEMCNRFDDDCDGTVDEGVRSACEATIIHAMTDCVPFANTARCVLLSCHEGYDNCDGDPANGCEPFCTCNPCEDDAGTEDAGSE